MREIMRSQSHKRRYFRSPREMVASIIPRSLKKFIIRIPGFSRAYELLARADVGFHGDAVTRAFVRAVIQDFGVTAFVETGTFRGDTAKFVAKSFPNLPVHSCELNEKIVGKARRRLRRYSNVFVYLQSSEEFLTDLFRSGALNEPTLFWLDAHWYDYWPLQFEVEIITRYSQRAIILIDDFQVPGNPQFGYDIGGGGTPELSGRRTVDSRVCNFELIRPHLSTANDYGVLYPRYDYSDAFGSKRSFLYALRGYVAIFQNQRLKLEDFARRRDVACYFRNSTYPG